jgi:hypothetical protein
MTIRRATMVLLILSIVACVALARAQHCHREGTDVGCDDRRRAASGPAMPSSGPTAPGHIRRHIKAELADRGSAFTH